MPEHEHDILCCGASIWAKSIGWFCFVLNIAYVFILFVVLTLTPWEEKGKDIVVSCIEQFGGKAHKLTSSEIYTEGWFLFFQCNFGLLLACLLLRGSYKESPILLKLWIIMEFIYALIGFIGIVVTNLKQDTSSDEGVHWIITVLLALAIEGFFLWIVRVYEQELLGKPYGAEPEGETEEVSQDTKDTNNKNKKGGGNP